jgi:hypothetical protein
MNGGIGSKGCVGRLLHRCDGRELGPVRWMRPPRTTSSAQVAHVGLDAVRLCAGREALDLGDEIL